MTTLYLGTHKPQWLPRHAVPMFLSRRRLAERVELPRAIAPWALDSGGFTELSLHGEWRTTAAEYVAQARRFRDEVGSMKWAAIQDWMCEPFMLKKTGLTVAEHQQRTIDSYAQLLDLAPEMPWTPVLQGWDSDDYLRHRDGYEARGFDLRRAPVVGLGSVCRRQHTGMAERLIRRLAGEGYRLHGFGFKIKGLLRVWGVLESADSLAWSFDARYSAPLPECSHASCSNCARWALRWWGETIRRIETRTNEGTQLKLWRSTELPL